MADDSTVTSEDVDDLNRQALDRSSAIARIGGTVLVIIGILGALAWLWLTIRAQQEAQPAEFDTFGDQAPPDISLGERITLVTTYLSMLLWASVAAGLGVFLRVVADAGQTYAGGSITGFQVGQSLVHEIELDDDDPAT
jgi:hypothetical protein